MRNPFARLRWFDAVAEDPSAPVDWRSSSMIIATLFLNFTFCYGFGLGLGGFGSLAADTGVMVLAALLVTLLFFVGPALAAQASGRSVFDLLESSFGTIPAIILRGCIMIFLVCWMAEMIEMPLMWAISARYQYHLRSTTEALIAIGALVFVFFTGQQNTRENARMAFFTNKLFIAIVIAALVRAYPGWSVISTRTALDPESPSTQLTRWVSYSGVYFSSVGFLAADFGSRTRSRRHVALVGLTGFAFPIFGVLLTSMMIAQTIPRALFSQTAGSAVPPRMMIVAFTVFGALRFAARMLVKAAPARPQGRVKWGLLAVLIAAIAAVCAWRDSVRLDDILPIAATCLAVTSAVLTADYLSGRTATYRRIDWLSTLALLSGLAIALYLAQEFYWIFSSWLPGLIGGCLTAFGVSLGGRAIQIGLAHLPRRGLS